MNKVTNTLPNSQYTAEENAAMREDIFLNYKPALRNSSELCEKWNISRERLNQIYKDEMKKQKGKIVGRKKIFKNPKKVSGFVLEGKIFKAFTKICILKITDRSSILRGLVEAFVADFCQENGLTVEELLAD